MSQLPSISFFGVVVYKQVLVTVPFQLRLSLHADIRYWIGRQACDLIELYCWLVLMQVEIIKDLPEDKTITVYRCGPLVDLCRGPHIPNTSHVKAFACLRVCSTRILSFSCYLNDTFSFCPWGASVVFTILRVLQASASYWRGQADRESLQRVYGISYPDSKLLKVRSCESGAVGVLIS